MQSDLTHFYVCRKNYSKNSWNEKSLNFLSTKYGCGQTVSYTSAIAVAKE